MEHRRCSWGKSTTTTVVDKQVLGKDVVIGGAANHVGLQKNEKGNFPSEKGVHFTRICMQ